MHVVMIALSLLVAAPADPQQEVQLTKAESQMIDAVNVYRAKYKLPPLKADAVLMKVAQERVPYVSMQRANQPMQNGWNHRACGMWSNEHANKAGFKGVATDNLAMGDLTPKEAVDAWGAEDRDRNPLGHNKQMQGQRKLNGRWVDEHFDRIGVAIRGHNYIAIFGKRKE